jgi:hypothetical protein
VEARTLKARMTTASMALWPERKGTRTTSFSSISLGFPPWIPLRRRAGMARRNGGGRRRRSGRPIGGRMRRRWHYDRYPNCQHLKVPLILPKVPAIVFGGRKKVLYLI